jgi:hypothetical protein
MMRLEREAAAAVLQDEAHALGGNVRTEGAVDALDPAGDVAVLVDHGVR